MKVIYVCPLEYAGCQWEGDKAEILTHFEDFHNNNLTYTSEIWVDTVEDALKRVLLYHFNRIYLVQTNITSNNESGFGKRLTVALRFLGAYDVAASHNYYVEVHCGTFSFNHNSSGVISTDNGLVVIDLGNVSLITTSSRHIKLKVVFDKLPKSSLIYSDVLRYESEESNDEVVETVNQIIREQDEKSESDDGELLPPMPVLVSRKNSSKSLHDFEETTKLKRQNSSRRYSLKSLPRRRSSTVDIDHVDSPGLGQQNQSLLSSLKCSFCKLYASPPVYKCGHTHVACVLCRTNNCCECDTQFRRSSSLDELSKLVRYPCRFAAGCGQASLKAQEVLSHEVVCHYASYHCPICTEFSGNFHQFVEHVAQQHRQIKLQAQMTNPFPEDATFIIANANSGIFLCSSLRHNSVVDYKIVFCGAFRVYIECCIVFMGKCELRYSLYGQNAYTFVTTIPISELKAKQLKHKYAMLVVSTNRTH